MKGTRYIIQSRFKSEFYTGEWQDEMLTSNKKWAQRELALAIGRKEKYIEWRLVERQIQEDTITGSTNFAITYSKMNQSISDESWKIKTKPASAGQM